MRYDNRTNIAGRNQLVQAGAREGRSAPPFTRTHDREVAKRTKRSDLLVTMRRAIRAIRAVDWQTATILGLLFGAPVVGALIIHFVLGG